MTPPSSSKAALAAPLVVIDGTNSLYRAFFAIPNLRAPDGTPTNAAYGFLNMLLKVVREEQPAGVIAVFDARGKTFRHRMYPEYKAGRDAQPEDLSAQFPIVHELIEAHGVPIVEVGDFEADDVIATLAASVADRPVRIVSTDKDLMQLVSERVTLLDGMKDRRYGPAEVEERFGVPPERVLDLRALVGDPSDNIPGVKGIGQKGAAKLIQTWGDLENLIAHREEITPNRAKNALESQLDEARLSKDLSTLRDDVPLPLDPVKYLEAHREEPDPEQLRELYSRFGFTRLLDALDEADGAPGAAAVETDVEVEVVTTGRALAAAVETLSAQPLASILPVVDWQSNLRGDPVAIAFATGDDRAVFVPLGDDGLEASDVIEALRPVLEAPGTLAWVGSGTKHTQLFFAERGLDLAPPNFDVGLAGQVIDPAGAHSTAALAGAFADRKVRTWEELAGRGAKAKAARDLPRDELAAWAADEVCAVRALTPRLTPRIDGDELTRVFEEIELPLTAVLARMERAGVRIDESVLAELSTEYESLLAHITARIHKLAGEEFLVSSPKQLQHILFEKLKLPVVKKTKTGYSTDEDVLEQLAAQHELPAEVLAYRRLSKLKNTYVDALPPLVDPETGRIHPTFNQIGAATGRMSATNPNVQNIPIRTPEGIRIREAFVPAEGCRLLSADYSQIELRVLAHYSEDDNLMAAFRDGDDVHRRTAAEVAGIDPEDVTPEQRDRAKAVNFGIIYGSSAFGLARQLKIASAEAQETIDAYFARYQGVRKFLDETVARAKDEGFVRTLMGRRRYLPDLGSRNRVLRNAAERMAVNTVIQGTAADMIKLAMLRVDEALEGSDLNAAMILQVHDELVLEVAKKDVEPVGELLCERMEGVVSLRVPLVVDVGSGASWREAH